VREFKKHTGCLMGLAAVLTSILLAGCDADRDPILGGGDITVVRPTATAVNPGPNATGVPLPITAITAYFSEAMAPIAGGAQFTVTCAAPCQSPTGTVSLDASGTIATYLLTSPGGLEPLTLYTATISGARSLATGTSIASPYIWHFMTAAIGAAPTVSVTSPLPNAAGVAINTLITAGFSEPIDPLTLNTADFTLACPAGTPITGTVAYAFNDNAAIFTPASPLPANTPCSATISTGVEDIAHNPMTNTFTWVFTTGATADTTPPTVSSTTPLANVTGVAINTLITASFSEPMDPLTLTATNFSLACPAGTPVTGTVGYAVNGNVATFTPASNLPANTACSATITTGVTDAAHNAMVSAFTWVFTTGATADTTPPTVSSTTPPANVTGVAINTLVTASFSEPMDPYTLTNANFTLACPAGTPISGTVGHAVNGNAATFTPANPLPANTNCSATITTGVTDVAHNAMVSAFTWIFTTGATPDITPPTVSSTTPLANATGVAINTLISASFSEPMDPLTVTTANFSLACPAGTPITGTVGYAVNGNVATFTPASNLPPNTACSATITTGVTDAAHNAMANAFTWVFTTGATPDTTRPTVSSTTPLANATGVAINSLITASFSEPMDPQTLTTANFTLACPTGTPITGTVGYAVNGNVATFTPANPLPANTNCSATVTSGVTDVAHNAMASAFTWVFTTGAAPDTTPPTVLSTNPAAGAVGVCMNKALNVTFSEPMDPLTITTATVTLATTPGVSVTGLVSYDSQTNTATFKSTANLTGSPATNYTATIQGGANGVKDIAGNALIVDYTATFTTDSSTCTTAPALGAVSSFGGFGGRATLTNDGLNTVINGDIGVSASSTSITGLRDSGGNVYTITPNNNGIVNGSIYTLTAPPGSVAGQAATQARTDALTAFNSISPGSLAGGIDVSSLAQCPSCGGAGGGADELAGRTLPPGIYLSATGSYQIGGASHTPGNLTLDAGGDANAVWVFQTAANTGTLTVGLTGPATPAVPIQVLLINGAQPKNVFWFVPGGATIGTGSTMVGTMLANASITMSTTGGSPPTAVTTTVNGRAIALTAAVTMTNTVVNVPAP
jgi:ice-binding like protein/Big-like domain-containing protein